MKIIFKTKFGSHLYGTNTPTSDLDYKGVFIASMEDIVLMKDKKTVRQDVKLSTTNRNTSGDVDTEYKELREFLKDAMDGQTYALDMLFAPREYWLESTPVWEELLRDRHKLLSTNVKPFLGYIRQQTAKYGLKGARLGELQRVLKYYEVLPENDLVGDHPLPSESEFVRYWGQDYERNNGLSTIHEDYLEVLGKKFSTKARIGRIVAPLRKFDEEYGKRSRMAANNEGVDWKAVSHAFRCCFQLIELADEQFITFPLKEADYLKKIKAGQIPWLELQDTLATLMDESFKALTDSNLPAEPDRQWCEDFILKTYL